MALFATFGGVFLYLEYFSRYSFETTLEMIKEGNLYGKILALAARKIEILLFRLVDSLCPRVCEEAQAFESQMIHY